MRISAAFSIFTLGLSLVACTEAEMEPLDSFQKGDVWAKKDDIKITKDTKVYVRSYVSPYMKNMISPSELRNEKSRSESYARWIMQLLQGRGNEGPLEGGADPRLLAARYLDATGQTLRHAAGCPVGQRRPVGYDA